MSSSSHINELKNRVDEIEKIMKGLNKKMDKNNATTAAPNKNNNFVNFEFGPV